MAEDLANDKIKKAIGELLREADAVSQLVISSYKHTAHHSVNVKALSSSKFKTEQLETCANFLGLKTRDESNSPIFTNKPTLADRVITKIESFFPSTCQDCGEGYRVKFSEQQTPHLHCFLCLQPSHDCDKVKAYMESLQQITTPLNGSAWLCTSCYEKNNPLLSNNRRKRSGSVSSVTLDNVTPSSSPALSRLGLSPNTALYLNPDGGTQSSPAPSNQTLDTVRRASATEDALQEQANQSLGICPEYANNRCPHGMNGNKVVNDATCPHSHPRRCRRFCKFGTKGRIGCQKGDRCSYYHPKLCRNSVSSLSCYNDNCKFVHLQSTKRKKASHEASASRNRSQSRDSNRPRHDNEWNPNPRRGQPRDDRFYPQREPDRYNSAASQQNNPITPSLGGYTSNSSDVSFLVRMIQDMKNEFQKDLCHLRDSISSNQTRWNPPVLQPGPPPPSQHLSQTIQQDPQISYQPILLNQTNPLWSQNTPLYSS